MGVNGEVDGERGGKVYEMFLEMIIVRCFREEGVEILRGKKKVGLLKV